MRVLSSKELAFGIKERLKKGSQAFSASQGRPPCLAVIRVGEDPASQVYVRNKIKACGDVGMDSQHHHLAANVAGKEIIELIHRLNQDPSVDGILLQLPLPQHLQADEIIDAIDPQKDVDGLTTTNQGLLFQGRSRISPCTPAGVMEILKGAEVFVAGRPAVVVGRSQIVGQPMAQLLLQADATVTVAHSKTKNLESVTRSADILVVAAGRPLLIGREHVKPGAVVIDVGIHKKPDGKLCGDVRFDELQGHAAACTPVPGGVGPMTITMLLANTLCLAELRLGLSVSMGIS